jgi:hypothetical protein
MNKRYLNKSVMFKGKRKYEVSDPGFYDSLIARQKKLACRNPNDAMEWVKLGGLCESKLDMTNCFAKRNLAIRYFIPGMILLFLLTVTYADHFFPNFFMLSSFPEVVISIFIVISAISFPYLWFLRYPPSGRKFFKKAFSMDPDCGDACMHLGLIALRRHQKKKACRLLEQAVRLNVHNKNKIEHKLKSIYEKEFMSFFKEKSEKKIRQQEIINHQLDQIRRLRLKNANLEKRVATLISKVEQARWETGRKAKLMNKEVKDYIGLIRKDYEDQIAAIKQEAREEAKELAERDFARLSMEILESKADLEVQSLAMAGQRVQEKMGKCSWKALPEETRSYLATAEQVYTVLTEQEEKPDYSLVGMELCKALETEINQKLVEPFTNFLNGNKQEFLKTNQTGEKQGRPIYFTYLAKVVDQVNYPKVQSLTLGQYHFILKLTLEEDYALKDYGSFLDTICTASGAVIGKMFMEKLETVVKRYRNVIAHRSSMNKKQYAHLKELVFSGNSSLLNTCCAIESTNSFESSKRYI